MILLSAPLVPSSIDHFDDSIEMTFYNSPHMLSEVKNEDSLVESGSSKHRYLYVNSNESFIKMYAY